MRFESFRLLYVNRFEHLRDEGDGSDRIRRDLWPLFTYRDARVAGGERGGSLRAPWIVPIVGEGFFRHFLGLFTFYEARWLDGERRADWLWGLGRSRRAAGYRLDAFSWLLRRPGRGAPAADACPTTNPLGREALALCELTS